MLTLKGNIKTSGGSASDITVTVYGKKVQSGTYNANFQSLKSGKTNSSGNFSIEIEKENISEYKIVVSKNKYFTIEDIFYSGSFTDDVFSKNYNLYLSADLTIIVKNDSPNDDDDYFKYKITSGYIDAVGSCSEIQVFDGTNIDEEYNCKVIGSQDVVFEWIKIKNGNKYTGNKSIYSDTDSDNLIEFYY